MTATITDLRNVPKQARAHATLTAIVEAARQAAGMHGYDRFTTSQVSELSGYSIGTVYRYFPNRIGLLEAIDSGREVAADVRAERARQDTRWGIQDHPDGSGPMLHALTGIDATCDYYLDHATGRQLASAAQVATMNRAERGIVSWADILLEEVFEALAEEDPVRLRAELIQVAAVAQQWASAIDRRAPREEEAAA